MNKSKTKRKQLSKFKLSKKEFDNRYDLLMDFMNNIPDVIYFKDIKGRFVLVNNSHAKGVGMSPEEVIGKTDFDFFPKKRAERMAKDDTYVMKTGKPIIDKIERATRPDGVDNYVSTTKIPRYSRRGKLIGLVGITRDVTKRMQYERLKEERLKLEKKLEMMEDLNNMKSDFISTVSHELKTPLAIIKQLIMLIFNEATGPINIKQREVLVKATQNLERLKNIIDKLLDMSRIEKNKLNLRYSLVNLNDILKDTQAFFKELAAEKSISLTYSLPKKEISIFIDAERILQVISNLITNAIKFTEENGKIKVEIKVLESKIRIGIIDTGIGISKEDLPKVFSKFVQANQSEETRKKGIGLGLSIVKELVEKHGGEIWIESELGVGSKCFFTLPRFFTADVLGTNVRKKVNNLLENNKTVSLINLVIINYEEFKKRIDIGPKILFEDLKNIINSIFETVFKRNKNKQQVVIADMKSGRYSIIFPQTIQRKIIDFCELLKKQTKNYFVKHKLENVFIAVGILSYTSKDQFDKKRQFGANLKIKEIYIGSEMRRARRINYKANVEVIFPSNEKLLLETVDISRYGICIISPKQLKTDTKVSMSLELLKIKKTININAKMAWQRKMERLPGVPVDQYKVGFEFTSLDNKDLKILLQELKLYYG